MCPESFRAKLPLHPDKPERGYREYCVKPDSKDNTVTFWITKRDADTINIGKMIRLMELFNIEPRRVNPKGIEANFSSEPYEHARAAKPS